MAKKTYKSKLFNKLSTDEKKTFHVRTSHSSKAGVRIIDPGTKKGVMVDILVPSTSVDGSDRIVKMSMTGRQARALFATLRRYYQD